MNVFVFFLFLSVNALNSLPYDFTLAAYNPSIAQNTTGLPLVLGQNGAIDGAEFEVTSTYASFPFNDWPSLALVDTSLRAFSRDHTWITNATQTAISNGPLGWLTTSKGPPAAATGYTAEQPAGSPFSLLAYRGEWVLWSLCPFEGGQTNVVFNVSRDAPTPGFDAAKCYTVILNIVPV